jgi:membrane protease YdiL (CAAX protease family)
MKVFVQRYPFVSYFGSAFLISWGSGFIVFIPRIFRGEVMPPTTALLLFPVLVISVALTGIILTGIQEGKGGVRNLFSRMSQWRVGVQWCMVALLTSPILILLTLFSLRMLVFPDFVPNFFPLGVLFGIIPGFLEEIGWIGYAFPKMRVRSSALSASILLGVMWGLWHLPVVDSLGAASPHGEYWLPSSLPSSLS